MFNKDQEFLKRFIEIQLDNYIEAYSFSGVIWEESWKYTSYNLGKSLRDLAMRHKMNKSFKLSISKNKLQDSLE